MRSAQVLALALLAALALPAAGCKKKTEPGEAQTARQTAPDPDPGPASQPTETPGEAQAPDSPAHQESTTSGGLEQTGQAEEPEAQPSYEPPPLPDPPFITLGVQTKPGEIVFCEGQPVPLYFKFAEDTPDPCLVTLVPDTTQTRDAESNMRAALITKSISGSKQGQELIIMPGPGSYRLRLFTGSAAKDEFVSEAQPFRVVSRAEWAEMGEKNKAAGKGAT